MRAYTYAELGALKPQILQICNRVADDNPTAWREAHNGNWDDDSARYNDLCVQALRAAGIYAGRNGKRGGSQLSDDVLAFGLTDQSGAPDTSGRFPSIAIIDFIGGAGGPNPSVGWNDVSKAAPGRFVEPQGLARVDGQSSPPPSSPPISPPSSPPSSPVDLGPVLRAIGELELRIVGLEAAVQGKASSHELHELVGHELIPHIDDMKRIALGLPRDERFR